MRKRIIQGLAAAALAVCIGGVAFAFRETDETISYDYETFPLTDKSAAAGDTIKMRLEATLENLDLIESAEVTFSIDYRVDVDIKTSESKTLSDSVQEAVKNLVANSINGITTEDVYLNIV